MLKQVQQISILKKKSLISFDIFVVTIFEKFVPCLIRTENN